MAKDSCFSYFTPEKDRYYLEKTVEVAERSVKNGNTPFGAILVDQEGVILLEQENIEITTGDCTGHAETALMRKASKLYSRIFLSTCSLYSSVEPCVMCAGAIYWGNIGRLVYGLSEKRLLEITGNNEQNPTLDLPCRYIFDSGQKNILVVGPFPDMAEKIEKTHLDYWPCS